MEFPTYFLLHNFPHTSQEINSSYSLFHDFLLGFHHTSHPPCRLSIPSPSHPLPIHPFPAIQHHPSPLPLPHPIPIHLFLHLLLLHNSDLILFFTSIFSLPTISLLLSVSSSPLFQRVPEGRGRRKSKLKV